MREVSGFGAGIYFSHRFTLWWGADAARRWIAPSRYWARSRCWDGALRAYLAFLILNGTVVYERGFIRRAGIALCSPLFLVAPYRLMGLPRNTRKVRA